MKYEDQLFNALNTKNEDQGLLTVILADYENIYKDVERKQNITLTIGTILLTSSFIILGQIIIKPDVGPIWGAALLSLGLYLFWLILLHYTTRIYITNIYDRLNSIENALGKKYGYEFGVTGYLNDIRRSNILLKIRTAFWQTLLLILSIFWLIIGYYA